MERFLSDQPSMAVINYNSNNYGGFLFRSPNSPPPSPSLSPPPSIASLSHLFFDARFNHGSRSPVYRSSPAGFFQQPQPPLLPLPRSTTLPAPIPSATVRSKRNDRRKGKVFPVSRKETSPPSTKVKEDRKPAIAAKEVVKYESQPLPEEEEKNSSNGDATGGLMPGYCIIA